MPPDPPDNEPLDGETVNEELEKQGDPFGHVPEYQ
jgi:hypothetical protein